MSGFRPSRGKVAIRHITEDDNSSSGIIYTPQENTQYGKAEVLSIGHPEINDNGKPIETDFNVGDFIIYSKKEGWGEYSGIRLIQPLQVVAIISKDTKIG